MMRALYLPAVNPAEVQIASAIDAAAFQYLGNKPADTVADQLLTNLQTFTGLPTIEPVIAPIHELHGRPDITQDALYEGIVQSAQRLVEITSSDGNALSLWMQDIRDAFHPNRRFVEDAHEHAPEPVGMMLCQGDGSAHLTFLNEINRKLSGLSIAEVPGTDVSRFFDETDRPRVKAYIRRCLADTRATERGIPMRRHNGELIKVDMNAWQRTGREATFQVINETIREDALRQIRIAEQVRHASTAAIATFQFDGLNSPILKEPSAGLYERLGFESGELDNVNLAELLPPGQEQALQTHLRRFAESGTFHWEAVPLRSKVGQEILFDLQGRASEVEGIRYAEIHLSDTEARLAAERDAADAAKADIVITLGSRIAHDFNNGFTGLMNGLRMLEGLTEPAARSGVVETLIDMTDEMVEMTKSLRNLVDTTPPGVGIDLNALLEKSLSERALRILLQGQADIHIDSYQSDDPWLVAGSQSELWKIGVNFAKNAIEAMADSDTQRLTIRTAQVRIPDEAALQGLDPQRRFDRAQPGDYVAWEFEDTGPGIPDEILMRIFEDGFSTKSDSDVSRGQGLGSVYSAVAMRGGLITVKTQVGRGTCFTVYLPRINSTPIPQADASEALAAQYMNDSLRSPGDEVILVADDEIGIRNMLERILRFYGYDTVLYATTGDELLTAFKSLQASQITLSAVIMDWRMDIKGSDLAMELFQINPEIPILVFTGAIPDEAVLHPKLQFLTKPQKGPAFAQALRDVIEGRTLSDDD